MIPLTIPSKTLLQTEFLLVAISIPLFSTITPDKMGCLCLPNFDTNNPYSTGQGSFPLFFIKDLDNNLLSGVSLNFNVLLSLISFCIIFSISEII